VRARRHRLTRGRLAWRGARYAWRRRIFGLIAWRGARWYLRRRRVALRLAFAAAVAAGTALRRVRARRRSSF
jgi:hypothetical protein